MKHTNRAVKTSSKIVYPFDFRNALDTYSWLRERLSARYFLYKKLSKDVKKWNVSVVSVNKHKRHLDPTAAHSFWRLVDDHIARRKKEKAGAAPARRKK